MAQKVIMPKQGLQMTEGTITNWIVKEGGVCKADEPLFEMETDKLTITISAEIDGTLLKIVRGEGEVVPITETIAVIGNPGEDISAILAEATAQSGASAAPVAEETAPAVEEKAEEASAAPTETIVRAEGERVFITPRAKELAIEKGIDYTTIKGSGEDGLIIEADIKNAKVDDIKVTPLAAKDAKAAGIDLHSVSGTGFGGKIRRADIAAAIENGTLATVAPMDDEVVPLTGMRKAIAKNMMASLSGTAQASIRVKVDMTNAMELRATYKAADKKVSYNDILVKACTLALEEFPVINASMDDKNITYHHYCNIGIAVAIDGGLIVPNIKHAELLRLEEISKASADLVAKAREGKLKPDEYKGGTFTITNLGSYDVDEFIAVINPPESAILAVGSIVKTPVVVNDEIVIKPIMKLSLTYDHRIVDGGPAAKFLNKVRELIEHPCLML